MPAKYKIDRLFYFNVGSHGIPQSKADFDRIENKFATRYNSLKRYADEVGLDFIPVDTNVHNFHPWGHLESSTFVSTSAALFMQPCIRRYYLSSSGHNYAQIMKFIGTGGEFKDLAMLDPMLLPMLSTETLDMIADGTELDRIEKTRIISTYEPTRRFLNVCAAKDTVDTNCSMCYKCCRTLLNLEILGKLEDYSQVFDLQKYRQVRANFIADTIVTRNEELYSLHLCEFAESQNYDLRAEISAADLMRAKLRRHNFYKLIRINPVARAAFDFSEKLKK